MYEPKSFPFPFPAAASGLSARYGIKDDASAYLNEHNDVEYIKQYIENKMTGK